MPPRAPVPDTVDLILDRVARLFDDGDLERALARVDEALSRDASSAEALHWRAAILAELGQAREAADAYEAAVAVSEDDVDVLLDAADFYVSSSTDGERVWSERALALARSARTLARRRGDDAAIADVALVEAAALSQLGLPDEALPCIDEAVRLRPDDPAVLLERGLALFELCRFEDARTQLLDVARLVPDTVASDSANPVPDTALEAAAWAHHTLGLVAERAGDLTEATREFERGRELAPEEFPQGVALSADEFDAALEDALRSLPEQVRSYLANVAIAVEDVPAIDDLLASSPPLSPSILGIFRGSPFGEKASMNPWSHFPSSIVVYQKNLERFARDRDELIEEIRVTLLHEVGHFLGLDEDDLWQRGLD